MADINFGSLAHEVQRRTGQSRNEARASVTAVLDAIGRALAAGHRVRLNNFGSFEPRVKHYHSGDLQGTGVRFEGEVKVIKFTATGALRQGMQEGTFNTVARTYAD